MNQYVFSLSKTSSANGITDSLKRLMVNNYPVILCVGSDLAIGDSLGPLIGSELSTKLRGKAYVYGTLNSPITAKEVEVVYKIIKNLHPKSKFLVIDAAVGEEEDIGTIKVSDMGIKPGLGVKKQLSLIGDVSIIAIVANKNNPLNNLLYSTRLSLVYKLSKNIVNSIVNYLK